jgi:hypothetical protein
MSYVIWKTKNVYQFFVSAPQEKRPFGSPRSRREDDSKINVKGVELCTLI